MRLSDDAARRNILIVDDSNFDQSLLKTTLGRTLYKFSSAHSGAQGYELARSLRPDLILLDVRLPDLDGFAVCRLLKAAPDTRDIPVIFLSAACMPEQRLHGLRLGAVDYVSKPCAPDELSMRMQIHLRLATQGHAPERQAGQRAPEMILDAAPAPAEDIAVMAAKRFILEHLAALPPLAQIARSVGTYREKLSPLFRAQTGMSIFEFIRKSRIAYGQKLLADTAMDVQDIAVLTGFDSGATFTTAFRAVTGRTPSAHRRHAREYAPGGKTVETAANELALPANAAHGSRY